MTDNIKSYRAIFFDLDGTLLPMDIDEFMQSYFKRIAAFAARSGFDASRFMDALMAGTKTMLSHTDDMTNEAVFWNTFRQVYGPDVPDNLRPVVDDFYGRDFPHIADGFEGDPAAARIVDGLAEKGYTLVLATTPLFPRLAIEWRLKWAGIDDPSVFARITSYENSKAAKPSRAYYAENLAALGLSGADVLMVGNNTEEDLSFIELGADAYLITDFLLDPLGYDLSSVRHGTMADFEAWACGLPACAQPAERVRTDAIEHDAIERALAANLATAQGR